MKLFNIKINDTLLSNSPLYSILAVYMPLTSLIAYILLFDSFINVNFNVILLCFSGAVSAIAASFYHDFMKDVKSDRKYANTRGGIIIMAILYFFTSFFYQETPWPETPWIERFLPNIMNIPAVLCALYSWISVILLKQLFSARKRFEIITEMYEGDKLKEKLFEDSSLLQYTEENINKVKFNYYVQLGIIGLITAICIILNINLPFVLYLFLMIILTGAVCIHGLFAIIKWEQYYAGEGINLSGHDRIKRILVIIIFSLSGLVLALLLSSDKSLVPFSIITSFFIWLSSLFRRTSRPPMPSNESEFFSQENFSQDFTPFEVYNPSPFWELFMKYASTILKYSLIILAAALFIRFMISPLLNRGDEMKKLTFRQKLIMIIKEWYNSILEIIKSFIAGLKKDKSKKINDSNNDDINRTALNIYNAYSAGKKRDVQGSVTLFARLIIWGEETRKVKWKPSLAPLEYCHILASASPADLETDGTANDYENDITDEITDEISIQRQNEQIIRCGVLFEKALYSAEDLSDVERNEFKNIIEEITSGQTVSTL